MLPAQLTIAADNFAQIFDANNSKTIRDIASALYIDRLIEFGIDEESAAVMVQAHNTSDVEGVVSKKENTAEKSGVSYSIKKTQNMPYNEQLRKIEKAEMNGSNSLYVGVPSEELQAIGFSGAPFAMNQGDYKKSRRVSAKNKNYSSHAVPYDFFENMPQYIAQSPLFIDNGKKITIVTEYAMEDTKGNNSYVIVGVLRNETMENDTVNLIKSVYPLDDFSQQITKAAEEGKLIVTNKNKVEAMLATIGIQPAEVSRIINLAKNTISQAETNVNTENSVNTSLGEGEIFAETDVEKTLSQRQAEIQELGKKIGRKIVFEDTRKVKGFKSDGYYNRRDGSIHIDYECENPEAEVLKHELVHFGETSPLFSAYKKTVADSKAFKQWLNKVMPGETDFILKKVKFREIIRDNYAKSGQKLSVTEADTEMICMFTAKVLFKDGKNGVNRLVNDINAKQRNSFMQFLKDFITYIKQKLTGNRGITKEIIKLENSLVDVLKTANTDFSAETTKNTAEDSDVAYSIVNDNVYTNYCSEIEKIYNKDDVTKKGKYIKVSSETPDIILRYSNADNLPMAILFDTAYLETRREGKLKGNYHNLGAENMKKLPELLENPIYIVELANKRLNIVVSLDTQKGNKSLVSIELSQSKQIDGKFNQYNLIITAFGTKDGYIQKIVDNSANKILYKKETDSQGTGQMNRELTGINASVSNNNIQQNDDIVNKNISKSDISYSIPTEVKDLLSQYDNGEISRDEYVAALDEKFGEAIDKYGYIEQGEKPVNRMFVPKQVTDDKYTRRFIRTFTETGKLTAEMIEDVEEQILLGETYSYKAISDEKAQKYADAQLENGDAETIWKSAVLDGAFNKNIIAIGEKL